MISKELDLKGLLDGTDVLTIWQPSFDERDLSHPLTDGHKALLQLELVTRR